MFQPCGSCCFDKLRRTCIWCWNGTLLEARVPSLSAELARSVSYWTELMLARYRWELGVLSVAIQATDFSTRSERAATKSSSPKAFILHGAKIARQYSVSDLTRIVWIFACQSFVFPWKKKVHTTTNTSTTQWDTYNVLYHHEFWHSIGLFTICCFKVASKIWQLIESRPLVIVYEEEISIERWRKYCACYPSQWNPKNKYCKNQNTLHEFLHSSLINLISLKRMVRCVPICFILSIRYFVSERIDRQH